MSMVERRGSPVYRQLEAYEEGWKKDHDAAMECRDWEGVVAVGIATGSLIERVDRAWRERVFRGLEDFCNEANDFHRTLCDFWLRVTNAVLNEIGRFENRFATLAGAAELREMETRIGDRLSHWQPPSLSRAVGLREMTLSPVAAEAVDRILNRESPSPISPAAPMIELSAEWPGRSTR